MPSQSSTGHVPSPSSTGHVPSQSSNVPGLRWLTRFLWPAPALACAAQQFQLPNRFDRPTDPTLVPGPSLSRHSSLLRAGLPFLNLYGLPRKQKQACLACSVSSGLGTRRTHRASSGWGHARPRGATEEGALMGRSSGSGAAGGGTTCGPVGGDGCCGCCSCCAPATRSNSSTCTAGAQRREGSVRQRTGVCRGQPPARQDTCGCL